MLDLKKYFGFTLLIAFSINVYAAQPPEEAYELMRTVGKYHMTVTDILETLPGEIIKNQVGMGTGFVAAILNANDWKDSPQFCITRTTNREIMGRVMLGLYELESQDRGFFSAAFAIPVVLADEFPCSN